MEITDELVDKLSLLSRLQFNEAEKKAIRNDLEKMIGFVDKLNELDTSGVVPLMHINEYINVLREDEVMQPITRVEALKNAVKHSDEFFLVPKVISK